MFSRRIRNEDGGLVVVAAIAMIPVMFMVTSFVYWGVGLSDAYSGVTYTANQVAKAAAAQSVTDGDATGNEYRLLIDCVEARAVANSYWSRMQPSIVDGGSGFTVTSGGGITEWDCGNVTPIGNPTATLKGVDLVIETGYDPPFLGRLFDMFVPGEMTLTGRGQAIYAPPPT